MEETVPRTERNPEMWQRDPEADAMVKVSDGVRVVVAMAELREWEKAQREPGGNDPLRGVKLNARLDRLVAGRAAGPKEPSAYRPEPEEPSVLPALIGLAALAIESPTFDIAPLAGATDPAPFDGGGFDGDGAGAGGVL